MLVPNLSDISILHLHLGANHCSQKLLCLLGNNFILR